VGKNFCSVPGNIVWEKGDDREFDAADLFPYRMVLPASTHFFRRSDRPFFRLLLLSLLSSSRMPEGNGIARSLPAVLRHGKRQLSLQQTGVIIEAKRPRPARCGLRNSSFHLATNLSLNGFIAGSFHKSVSGEFFQISRIFA